MKINIPNLLKELQNITEGNIVFAKSLISLDNDLLNSRYSNDSWSVLECLQHLNLYGDYYIPELNKRVGESHSTFQEYYTPGWLGNYFVKSIEPKDKIKKMKTLKATNPIHQILNKSVIDAFIRQQESYLELLEAAKDVNWNKVKTKVSISKIIKIKLGDTLRFVIYHNKRHVLQAQNVLRQV